jgi:hypothetical protein
MVYWHWRVKRNDAGIRLPEDERESKGKGHKGTLPFLFAVSFIQR